MQKLRQELNKIINKVLVFFAGVFVVFFFTAPASAVMCNDSSSPALTCDCPSSTTIKRPENHVVGPGGVVTIDTSINVVNTPHPLCICDNDSTKEAHTGLDNCGQCGSGQVLDGDGTCVANNCPAGSRLNADGDCVCKTDGATVVTTAQDVTDNCPVCESPATANSQTGLCKCPSSVFAKSVSGGKVTCGCPSGTTIRTAIGGVGLTANTFYCVCNVKNENGNEVIKTASNTCPAPPSCDPPRSLNPDGDCVCPAGSFSVGGVSDSFSPPASWAGLNIVQACVCSSDQRTPVTTTVASDCPAAADNRCIYSQSPRSTNFALIHPKTPENWGATMTTPTPRGICKNSTKCYRKSNTRNPQGHHGEGQCYPDSTNKAVICERICGAGISDCQIGDSVNISVTWKTSGSDFSSTETYKTVTCPVAACPFPKVLGTADATIPSDCPGACGDSTRGIFYVGNACPLSFKSCNETIKCVYNGTVGHYNGIGTTCRYKAKDLAPDPSVRNCGCPVGTTANTYTDASVSIGDYCVCDTDPENLPAYRGTIVKESPNSAATNPKEVGSVVQCTCPPRPKFYKRSMRRSCVR